MIFASKGFVVINASGNECGAWLFMHIKKKRPALIFIFLLISYLSVSRNDENWLPYRSSEELRSRILQAWKFKGSWNSQEYAQGKSNWIEILPFFSQKFYVFLCTYWVFASRNHIVQFRILRWWKTPWQPWRTSTRILAGTWPQRQRGVCRTTWRRTASTNLVSTNILWNSTGLPSRRSKIILPISLNILEKKSYCRLPKNSKMPE